MIKLQPIMKSSQEFGFFQVIIHGAFEGLMEETMNVIQEFFRLPGFYSNDSGISQICRIFSSTLNYHKEDFHYWSDNITHSCHPVEDYIQSLPEKPTRYRTTIHTTFFEARKFLLRILDLICEGLGLIGYIEGELTKVQVFLDWECQNTMILIS
ncbi:unnamed protein product [Coffea canephora]|uniref:DH200=94 genomic scaffold, scaffold_5986 n=1 Tax=Coffea canephora TaxID=49390 RepID=A0A068VPT0_COFCA|nr:unnamed protein product [Coffea canephora]